MQRAHSLVIGALVVGALAVAAALGGAACSKGVDLSRGGTRLTLRAAAGSPADKRDVALKRVAERFARAKVPVRATRSGEDLLADVPADGDLDRVKKLATTRGQLIVRDEATTEGQIVIDQVAGVRAERDRQSGRGTLIVTLRPDDAARVAALSQKLVGKKMVMALDNATLTRPLVQSALPGDRLSIPLPPIRDAATAEVETATIVAIVERGALPVAVDIALEEPLSPRR
jgi:preprotein translocase subunit SecD